MSTSSYQYFILEEFERKKKEGAEEKERRKREREEKRALKEKEKEQKRSAAKQTRSKVHCKGEKKSVRSDNNQQSVEVNWPESVH